MRKLFLSIVLALSIASPANADTYKIDASHSSVGFKIRHLAISSVSGRFAEFSGTFDYDPKNISASKVEAVIQAKSVDTDEAKRDEHLRTADFFDVDKFPELKYVSTAIKDASAESFKLEGNLTMHGVTRPVTLDVEVGGTGKDPYGNDRAAFSATAKLDRKDWGLVWSKVLDSGALVVGDEVKISIEIEGIKQKS